MVRDARLCRAPHHEDSQAQGGQSAACPPFRTALGERWWARRFAPLPTLVLARWFILTSFHEEGPSPGGRPGWAADRSDRCPPKPSGLSYVARSRSALHRDPDG